MLTDQNVSEEIIASEAVMEENKEGEEQPQIQEETETVVVDVIVEQIDPLLRVCTIKFSILMLY